MLDFRQETCLSTRKAENCSIDDAQQLKCVRTFRTCSWLQLETNKKKNSKGTPRKCFQRKNYATEKSVNSDSKLRRIC